MTRLPGSWRRPMAVSIRSGGPAVVDDLRPGHGGRGGELGVVAEEGMEPGVDVEPGPDRVEDRHPP